MAIEMNNYRGQANKIPGTMPYLRPGHRPAELGNADSWRHLLQKEDARCVESGFGAGVLSISFGATIRNAQESDDRLAEVLDVVLEQIKFTDKVCVLSPGEVAVLLIPLPEVHDAELRAIAIDEALRADGIDAGIGWAVRRPIGLIDAAARADANAATAHGRHLRLVD